MKYIFFVSIMCMNLSPLYAKGSYAREPECLAGVVSHKFLASFQIIDRNQKIWAISDDDHHNNEINYSWIVEPGFIKNGSFLPVKYAFGVGHRNEYTSKGKKEGSLSFLLNEIKDSGTIYINSKEKSIREKISRDLENVQIHIMLTEKEIILYSRNIDGRNALFSSKPTHARMTMRTPYKSQSYNCLTEIDYQ